MAKKNKIAVKDNKLVIYSSNSNNKNNDNSNNDDSNIIYDAPYTVIDDKKKDSNKKKSEKPKKDNKNEKKTESSEEENDSNEKSESSETKKKDNKKSKPSLMDKFLSGYEKISGVMSSINSIASAGMSMADSYINTSARLNIMNGNLNTTGQLQDKIFASAERSKGSYSTLSTAVTQLGMSAKSSFGKDNDEIVAFAETVQKAFVVSGKSAEDQVAGFNTLTQVMSAGKLQGKDFEQLIQKNPEVANAVASYMGKSTSELKNIGTDGAISADVIKNAMFAAAGGIDEQFNLIPDTFSDITDKSNLVQKAFEQVFEKISKIINSPAFEVIGENIAFGIMFAANAISGLIDGFAWLGGAVQENWDIIQPILIGLGAAIALLGMLFIGQQVLMAAGWLLSMWPILLLAALITGIIYAVIQCGTTVETVVGVIGGIFGAFFAFLLNIFALIANQFLSLAEFVANIFRDPGYAIQKIFYDLAINVMGFLTNIASGIDNLLNNIPGLKVNISGNMSNLLKTLENNRDNLKTDKDVVKLRKFEQIDYNTAFEGGKGFATNAFDSVQKGLDKISNIDMTNVDKFKNNTSPYSPSIDSIKQPVEVVGKNSDNLNVDMSQEDLKYLRDIAEREYINNFSTATLAPNISVSFGNVTKEADVDKVASYLQTILQEQIVTVAEGAY